MLRLLQMNQMCLMNLKYHLNPQTGLMNHDVEECSVFTSDDPLDAVPEDPEVPDEPEDPAVPDEPDAPEEPDVPDVPSSPEVPDVLMNQMFHLHQKYHL
jgi:hypothetical protein